MGMGWVGFLKILKWVYLLSQVALTNYFVLFFHKLVKFLPKAYFTLLIFPFYVSLSSYAAAPWTGPPPGSPS